MLEEIMKNTIDYMSIFPKEIRKNYGQFFTGIPTARYMSSLINIEKSSISILDAGCGNGILAASVIERLLSAGHAQNIYLTLYETDKNIIELLNNNLRIMGEKCEVHKVTLHVTLIQENFILYNANLWNDKQYPGCFDIVICNPPYQKIGKNAPESVCMSKIVHGQPNLYFLFMAMASHLLYDNGQMVFITPRSWTSGAYFKGFRDFLLEHISISHLHLFISRDKVFNSENVLQETMILSGKKMPVQIKHIVITTCNDSSDYRNLCYLQVPSNICLPGGENNYVLIPIDEDDVDILNFMSNLTDTPKKLGYQFRTGQIVEFRYKDNLRYNQEPQTIPLIQACNLKNGHVHFNINTNKAQYFLLDKDNVNMSIPNCNTVLLKRFTTKEERRRLQPAIHLMKSCPEIRRFTAENHINYLDKNDGELSVYEVYAIYTILSSSIWDRYYRILNGSTQVNSEELNNMPFPSMETLQNIGRTVMQLIEGNGNLDSDNVLWRALA